MAGGNVITKGASKRTTKGGTRAGGNVITKGASKKQGSKKKSNQASSSDKRQRRSG